MTTSQRPRGVSLPSIQEMFPEHLMQRWYPAKRSGSVNSSADPSPTINSNSPQTASEHAATYSHTKAPCDLAQANLPGLPHGRGVTSEQPLQSDVQRHHAQPRRHSQSEPGFGPRARTYEHPYAFDVLQSNPLTANLESVASRSEALPGTFESLRDPPLATAELTLASMRKPAFRVHQPKYSAHLDTSFLQQRTQASSSKIAGSSSVPQMMSFHPPEPSDDRRHCCPHCDKRFNRPSSLNIHVNTHTGAKPFKCEYPGCNRKFNVNSNMRRHWRNHMSARKREGAMALTRMIQPAVATVAGNHTNSATGSQPTPLPLSQIPMERTTSGHSPSVGSISSPSSSSCSSRSPSPPSPYLSDYRDDGPAMSSGSRSPWSTESTTHPFSLPPPIPHQPLFGRPRSGSYAPAASKTMPFSDSFALRQHNHGRPRSCSIAGCDCQPMTSSLRPAFQDGEK